MPINVDGVEMYAMADVAGEIGVSRQTLWRWKKDAKIPPGHRFRDGRVVFTSDEMEEIRRYANRLEPIDQPRTNQMSLFG